MRAQRRASDAGGRSVFSQGSTGGTASDHHESSIFCWVFHENCSIQLLGYHDFGKLYCIYIYTHTYIRLQKISTSQNQECVGNSYRFSSWKKELFLN